VKNFNVISICESFYSDDSYDYDTLNVFSIQLSTIMIDR